MKAFTRRLCLALVAIGMLGVTGCGPDNEKEGQNASSKLGGPGETKGAPVQAVVQPKDNAGRAAMGPQGSVNQQGKKQPEPDKNKAAPK